MNAFHTPIHLRLARVFNRYGIDTVEAANDSFLDVVQTPGFGKQSIRLYREFLNAHGYHPPRLYELEWYSDDSDYPHSRNKLTFEEVFERLRIHSIPTAGSHVTVRLFA